MRSAGSGAIRRGWIQVQTDAAAVGGLLIYRDVQSGIEVGVEPVQLGHEFALFVEESATVGAGLALFKPNESSEIEFQIRVEAGMDPIGKVLTWGDSHQWARTLPEWLEGTDSSDSQELSGTAIPAGGRRLFLRPCRVAVWEASRRTLGSAGDNPRFRPKDHSYCADRLKP